MAGNRVINCPGLSLLRAGFFGLVVEYTAKTGPNSTKMQCYRHPHVETVVSCGKCDRPICPRCMIPGPAGMRCPDCSSLRKTALYQISPARLALAFVAALVSGVVGAFLMTSLGFFVFFLGPLYGGFVAEAVLRASGRKRGRVLEVLGVGGIVAGALLVLLPMFFAIRAVVPGAPSPLVMMGLTRLAWPLVGFALAIWACEARLK